MEKFFYRVKEGETIVSVSKKFFVPTMCLLQDNMLKREILAGDILIIKKYQNCYEVQPLDTLSSISQKFNLEIERLSFLNGGITYVFYGQIITY